MDTSSASAGAPRPFQKLRRALFGAPRRLDDPSQFHKMSLVPMLAWIGLGADGLSSSAYGPEEAFRALGAHTYLAVFIGLAVALTVFLISYAYSKIIEHFPAGGGGYLVASHLLGPRAGVVSGSALLIDYVLTITVSVASCADALFSFLPLSFQVYKVPAGCLFIVLLIVLNLRGVRESILVLAPIFFLFIASHLLLLLDGVFTHWTQMGALFSGVREGLARDSAGIGWLGIGLLLFRAYSLGGGTFTGIEAVSNGMPLMREPRVRNGKRTMLYMALSLAFTAGVLLLCYGLLNVSPQPGRTLNAVLADALFADWPAGYWVALVTILSEGALLLVAAQAGFADGPRVMASMALDRWLPQRFSVLSERLTMQNGILLMGAGALALLVFLRGSVAVLVVMYAINVFVTFSLSFLAMFLRTLRRGREEGLRDLPLYAVGLALCLSILVGTAAMKFSEGGWLTVLLTSLLIGACFFIRARYDRVRRSVAQLDDLLTHIPTVHSPAAAVPDPNAFTAVQLVSGFNGFGVHTLLSIARNFPGHYRNIIFVSVALVDSGSFKGAAALSDLERSVREGLDRYVDLARRLGFAAEGRMQLSTDLIDSVVGLCRQVCSDFRRSTVFAGKLVFREEGLLSGLLHNEQSFAIQRRLQWEGVTTVILPIRVNLK